MSRPLHIFLAEDNPGDVELVREALREHNLEFNLFVATDGAKAKRYIARIGTAEDAPCPDLILLDLNLPKADGHELFAMLRAHPLCTRTPVIVLTSSNALTDRQRVAELGAERYFRKPSDLTEFLKLGWLIRDLAMNRGLLLSS